MSSRSAPSLELLLIGDFSGRASRGAHAPQELGTRKLRRVEPETLDALFAELAVELRLGEGGAAPLTYTPRSLDDLAPDALWAKLPSCERLRSLKRRLENPATFAEAARELGAELAPPASASAAPAAPSAAPSTPGANTASLLDSLLEESAARGPRGIPRTGEEIAQALVRELVIPHVVPAPHPRRDELVRAVDAAIADHLRALLRDRALRGAEIAWRSLDLLLRRIGVDDAVHVRVLDATTAELQADLVRETPLASTALHRALAPRGADPESSVISLWLLLEPFDAEVPDAALLARLGELAGLTGALVLGTALPRHYGCAALEPDSEPDGTFLGSADAARAWDALRAAPAAERITLATPRLLLRMPYGKRGEQTEALAFEELIPAEGAAGYLWGGGALATALFLGEQLAEDGALDPDATRAIERLPLHVREHDGETIAQPCAEVWLGDVAAERIRARGFVVLRSVRARDTVYLGPLRTLSGRALPLP